MLFLKVVGISFIHLALGHVAPFETEHADDDLGEWCGSMEKPSELLQYFGHGMPSVKRQSGDPSPIVISTHFHVVANSTKLRDGWLTDKLLQSQLRVLNDEFRSTGFSFKLEEIHRLVHDTWATSIDTTDHHEMKKALRVGDYKTLNIYFRPVVGESDEGNNVLGRCTLPTRAAPGSRAFQADGCQIVAGTVPGGTKRKYNMGKTAVHEVGHWLGLLHTFEGGCDGDGDFVADTPAEASAARGCPEGRNTCGGAGLDPIHNHMDYSSHACRTSFTKGQADRMHDLWNTFRLQADSGSPRTYVMGRNIWMPRFLPLS